MSSTNSQSMKPQFSILAAIRRDQAMRGHAGARIDTASERRLEANAELVSREISILADMRSAS